MYLVEERAVSFPQNIEDGPGAHPVFYSVGIGALSSAIKRPERESVHSPPSRAEAMRVLGGTPTRLIEEASAFYLICFREVPDLSLGPK